IDNWTQWHDSVLTLFDSRNQFQSFALPGAGWTAVRVQLRRDDVRYLYLRETVKAAFAKETDVQEVAYRIPRWSTGKVILRRATLIWSQDDCRLYRIDD